jgi:hypothetical protein
MSNTRGTKKKQKVGSQTASYQTYFMIPVHFTFATFNQRIGHHVPAGAFTDLRWHLLAGRLWSFAPAAMVGSL